MQSGGQFAVVTGASTGIGLELAKCCAAEGFDLLIAADEPEIEQVAASLRGLGRQVEAVQADLATTEGVDQLYAAAKAGQWMLYWPTRVAVSDATFSTRTSGGFVR
jgi:uncharacterized protein